eukprot:TRINITY_DN8066_c0_g1_i1.p1 TRINITY_DN8066_c0_g1~~TRINITY_DN8066_c0_g1_i1.p1  ORF type:complete len:348 (+),score=67.34 TRINITY_DN8066_c0_g1_i1:150-1193(+)
MSFEHVYDHVLHPVQWTGPDATWEQKYLWRNLAIVVCGTVWAFVFKLLFVIVDKLSRAYFARYRTLNKVQQVDWTSRIVAMFFIVAGLYFTVKIMAAKTNHRLEAVAPVSVFEGSEWRFTTFLDNDTLYLLFHYYIIAFGYELYDLKNCIDIKMYSGVLHHIVLLIIFPLAWSATVMSIPAVAMVTSTYLSNIPAHFRSFMVILGYRDTPAYKFNKWAWWLSYVVFRLFGIPWFSAVMWFSLDPIKLQVPLFGIAWYFSAMVCHYGLSLYWFVEMTKTMFPPDKQMKRVGSFPIFPQDQKKAQEKISSSTASAPSSSSSSSAAFGGKKPARLSKSSDSEDEGGQKFD